MHNVCANISCNSIKYWHVAKTNLSYRIVMITEIFYTVISLITAIQKSITKLVTKSSGITFVRIAPQNRVLGKVSCPDYHHHHHQKYVVENKLILKNIYTHTQHRATNKRHYERRTIITVQTSLHWTTFSWKNKWTIKVELHGLQSSPYEVCIEQYRFLERKKKKRKKV